MQSLYIHRPKWERIGTSWCGSYYISDSSLVENYTRLKQRNYKLRILHKLPIK